MSDPSDGTFSVPPATGAPEAIALLLTAVYDELHRLAEHYFRTQPHQQTLQPTALVHEAFLRIAVGDATAWTSRAHFVAVAATAMRHVLVDRARASMSAKRGGAWQRVPLDDGALPARQRAQLELLDLHDALNELARLDQRQ